MQERQATIEGVTHRFEPPFLVIATQNPIEYEGTYPLPEAQLDRFLLRTAFGYPSREGEVDVLARRIDRESDDVELRAVVDRETLLAMQGAVERVHVAESVREYCVDLVVATRTAPSCAVGASPRGSLALLKLARCRAALQGRDFVLPDDVKAVAVPGARAPAGAPPGAVGAARLGRGRRPGGARHGPDATRGGRLADAPLVTRTGNPRLIGYSALAAVGLLGALALRRPELAIVAAPFALLVVVGTRAARDPEVELELAVDDERTLERADLDAVVTVRARRPVDRLELLLELPPHVEVVTGDAVRSLRLRAGEERELEYTLRCTTWGVHELGRTRMRARDPFRIVGWEARGARQDRSRRTRARSRCAGSCRPSRRRHLPVAKLRA